MARHNTRRGRTAHNQRNRGQTPDIRVGSVYENPLSAKHFKVLDVKENRNPAVVKAENVDTGEEEYIKVSTFRNFSPEN